MRNPRKPQETKRSIPHSPHQASAVRRRFFCALSEGFMLPLRYPHPKPLSSGEGLCRFAPNGRLRRGARDLRPLGRKQRPQGANAQAACCRAQSLSRRRTYSLPLLLPRQDCKGRIRSCGGSIFNENATFAAATGLPHNPGILSRQKSQAIGYGPLEDNCLKIDKLQQAAPPNKGRATLDNILSIKDLSSRAIPSATVLGRFWGFS